VAVLDPALRTQLVEAIANDPTLYEPALVEQVRRSEPLLPLDQVRSLVAGIAPTSTGLGLIESLLVDPTIDEILINGPGPVWIDQGGALIATELTLSAYELQLLIERLVVHSGVSATRTSPIVDARLADGSRVNVVLEPLAVDGPVVSVRKFSQRPLSLASFGPPSLERTLVALLNQAKSMLVVGATSSGKTSLLNALSNSMPEDQRIICIEDRAELQMVGRQIVRLESRPANSEGVGHVSMRELIRTSLRMRPDRLVVGEVRGPEAFDLLLAITTGHSGCLTTCHAPSPMVALDRLVTLAGLADANATTELLQRTVYAAIDVVVVMTRLQVGRRVTSVWSVPPDPVESEAELSLVWSAPSATRPLISTEPGLAVGHV